MVLGVCRRALANFHDAEDACQATFLVLARKAASVRKKASLSTWLHGVACRVAANLKRDHARRKNRERRVDAPAPKDPAAEVSWREVQTILDEELQRLPERYRAPIILCYLECMTRDEAAKQIGVSPTTLHGRLERARDFLRACLSKRGLTLAAVLSAAALGESVAQAALAPTFVVSSTKAAMLLAAGRPLTESVVATHVLALTQEVIKSMFLTKLKLGTAAVLCASLFVALIGGSVASLSIAQDAKLNSLGEKLDSPSAKAESDEDFIRRISKDLRGTDPTPTEIHFFIGSKDAGRRQKLIDLFIQERQAKKGPDDTIRVVVDGNILVIDAKTAKLLSKMPPALTTQRGGPGGNDNVWLDIRRPLNGRIDDLSLSMNEAYMSGPPKETDLTDNVNVRLVGARRGAAQTAPLVAHFVTMDKGKRDLLVQFHSLTPTPHERLLMTLVELAVGGCGPDSGTDWKKAEMEVVFSIPNGGIDSRNRKDYEKCYLVSFNKLLNHGGPASSINVETSVSRAPFTFPSDEEVLRALPQKARLKNARITCELIEYHLDASKVYPGVGPARLAHGHFKCTVGFDGGIEVVYIDRNHLIPQNGMPTPPAELKGVIETIEPKQGGLLSISIGSDTGLAKDRVLAVYRLKPAPLYLGTIRIIDVSPQKAVARRVGSFPVGTPDLEVGDNVTSSLTAPVEMKKK